MQLLSNADVRLTMRDLAGLSTESLLGRDDAELMFPTTAGTWHDAKTLPGQIWMRGTTSVIILPVSQTAVYGGVTEHANIVHVRTTMCGRQTSPVKTLKTMCRGTFRED